MFQFQVWLRAPCKLKVNCVPSPLPVGAAIVLSTPKSRLRSEVACAAAPVKAGAVTVDQ